MRNGPFGTSSTILMPMELPVSGGRSARIGGGGGTRGGGAALPSQRAPTPPPRGRGGPPRPAPRALPPDAPREAPAFRGRVLRILLCPPPPHPPPLFRAVDAGLEITSGREGQQLAQQHRQHVDVGPLADG